MKMPLISVVIPCYNAEKYVGEAIRSALSQTYPNVEVIVVEDGSTDGSLDIIRSFGNDIRWEFGPNRGPSAARNRGIELARGKLVQFLDADDFLHPRKIEVQVEAALRYQPAIPICNYEMIDLQGCRQIRNISYPANDPVLQIIRRPFQTSAPLHWKELLLSVGGFRIGCYCDEDDLHIRLACAGASFFHVPEVLFTWRRVSGSMTDNQPRVVDGLRRIYVTLFNKLQHAGELTDERALALGSRVACCAYQYLHMGMTKKAMVTFRRARKMHFDAMRDGTETMHHGKCFHCTAYRYLDPVFTFQIIKVLSTPRRLGRAVQRLLLWKR